MSRSVFVSSCLFATNDLWLGRAVRSIVAISGGYQYLPALIVLIGWHCDVTFPKTISETTSGFISEKY
jgi:hypothetical protein